MNPFLATIIGIAIIVVLVLLFIHFGSSTQHRQHSISDAPRTGSPGSTEAIEQRIEESGVLVSVHNAVSRYAGSIVQGMDARSAVTGIVGAVVGAVTGTAVGTTVGFSLATVPATILWLLFTEAGSRTLTTMMERLEAAGVLTIVRDSVDRLARGVRQGVAMVGIPAVIGALGFPTFGVFTAVCALVGSVIQSMFNRHQHRDRSS